MTEYVQFPTLITKGLEWAETDGRRIFKGHITAEIIDKQNEFIFVKEVMAIMDEFMKINPVMSEVHTNRMVGKVLGYEKSEYKGVPTVQITGQVYKSKTITLYDKVWEKIVKGEYRGLSMGGASKEREPIMKDGRMALELRKLELYEIAICPEPANAFAIIDKVNTFAKSYDIDSNSIQELDGRCIIKCDQIGMCFEKEATNLGTDMNQDVDVDNHEYKCDGGNICEICGIKKEEHGLKQFDKPDEIEEKLRKMFYEVIKNKDTLTGRSASTRSDDIGSATFSPSETKNIITQIKAPKSNSNTIKSPQSPKPTNLNKQTVPETSMTSENKLVDQKLDVYDSKTDKNGLEKQYVDIEKILPLIAGALGAAATGAKVVGTAADIAGKGAEVAGKVVEAGSKVAGAVSEGVSNASKSLTVHQYIQKFGEEQVRKALEEIDAIKYLKTLAIKYQ